MIYNGKREVNLHIKLIKIHHNNGFILINMSKNPTDKSQKWSIDWQKEITNFIFTV